MGHPEAAPGTTTQPLISSQQKLASDQKCHPVKRGVTKQAAIPAEFAQDIELISASPTLFVPDSNFKR